MKKNYFKIKLLSAGLLVSLLANDLDAQMSGLYTINSGAATAGTNFQSFNDLESALSSQGINGPVTVDVVANSGPYNEQVLFTPVNGATAQNRITINGNDNLITYSSSNTNQRYTMGFNGADFFTVNDLQMSGTGSYAFTCLLYSGADYNVFSNCSFSVNTSATTTNYFPVVVSGSGSQYNSAANSGQYNLWENCETYGGYAGISLYSPTGVGTYMYGNKVLNCNLKDWYYYGIRSYYNQEVTISGNVIERPTRTNFTTTYGVYLYQSAGSLVEKNILQKLWEQNQTQTGTCYGFYVMGNSNTTIDDAPTHVLNNIVQDLRSHATIYAFYVYYIKGDFAHNTVSIDHPTATTGVVRGAYLTTTGDNYINVYNNLFYINRGGSSTKHGIYFATTNLVDSDHNNIYFGGAGTNKYAGYMGGNQTSLANLQSATSLDANSVSMDPMFINTSSDVEPTSALLNDLGMPLGITFDNRDQVRNQTTPDIGAIEFLSPTCAGVPTQSVVGPNWEICPGEVATFSIGNLTPDRGLTFQWQMSDLSAVGPYTLTGSSSGTNISYTSPPNITKMWYSAIITCTAPGGGSVQAVADVSVAATTTNSVPYYEDFEGIGMPDRLPNCSWMAPGLGASAQTYLGAGSNNLLPNSGAGFAAFSNPGATDYFYTNGIYMEPGITYSASLWYQTDLSGASNWTDLSILIGTAQNPSGLTSIATTGGPAVSIVYKPLSNTFTVSTAGIYYVAVSATGSNGQAMNLSWDDLKIEIPCDLNALTVNMSANKTSICAGESVVLTAAGADNYIWDNSAGSGGMVTVQPLYNTFYTVVGTNTNSGCSSSASQMIEVKPAPVMGIISNPAEVCEGEPLHLQAYGADTYNWSTGDNGPSVIVKPTSAESYTVQGTNSHGCTTAYVHNVSPSELPDIVVNAPGTICKHDQITVAAQGGVSYEWISNNVFLTTNPVLLSPDISTTYTVRGLSLEGCTGEQIVTINVGLCSGLGELSSAGTGVYPNPTSGVFTIETNSTENKQVQVADVTGRVIFSQQTTDATIDVNIGEFAAGVYYVQVIGAENADRIRIIKQ